jgi:sugar/nucleoside kinase (ribokinase family)
MNVLSAGFVCGDLVLAPVDDLPPAGGNRFVREAALTIGGCAANASVGFARLIGPGGGRAALAGRIGADPLGRLLQDALEAAGVDTQALLATPGTATAINTALVTSSGERSFYVFPGACADLTPADLPDRLLRQFDHLHLGAIGALPGLAGAAAAAVARRARSLGLTTSLDITLNPPRDTAADVLPLLPHVDLFLPNLTEAQIVLGPGDVDALLSSGLAHGVRLMGLKLGEAGCALATATERVRMPGFDVSAVDTVGAGDAWSVAVVYGWRQGWPLAEIGRFANAAGALSTLQIGATEGMADVEAIHRFANSDR